MQEKLVGLVGKKNKKRELMKDGINSFFSKTNNYYSQLGILNPKCLGIVY